MVSWQHFVALFRFHFHLLSFQNSLSPHFSLSRYYLFILSLCIFGSLPISFHFRCNTSSLYEIFIQFFHLLLLPKESHVFVTKLKRESTKGRVKVTQERERERKKEMNRRERERNRSILCPLLNQVMFDHVFFFHPHPHFSSLSLSILILSSLSILIPFIPSD